MSITKIQELRGKRAQLVKEAREVLDVESKENRDLTQEEVNKYEKIMKEVDGLRERIEREERLAGIENEFTEHKTGIEIKEDAENRTMPLATKEYREAFWKSLRKSGMSETELRTLNIGQDPEGGYLVPDEYHNQLIEGLEEQNVMRGLASTIQTSHGERLIPLVVDKGEAQWIGESDTYPESDAEFGRTTLGAYKLARITRVTEELLNDSMFDIAGFLSSAFARTFGDAEEKAFINGDGKGKPTGFLQDATDGGSTAVGDAITTDELLELYHALNKPYRSKGVWMMNDSTVLAIRKLKDANDQYIWQPGLQAGQPDRILGRPVETSRYMPELGADNKVVAFGDFSYYWIADRQSIGIQRLIELYAANGQVGFRMFTRTDGKLILPEAIVTLKGGSGSGGGVEG